MLKISVVKLVKCKYENIMHTNLYLRNFYETMKKKRNNIPLSK